MDLSANNVALWNGVLQLGIIAGALIAAHFLLSVIPALRKTMLPTAVLGGFLVLALRYLGVLTLDRNLLEGIAYHGIAIGFIAMSLRAKKSKPEHDQQDEGNVLTIVKTGAVIVSTYLLQGLIGLTVSLGLNLTIMPDFFQTAGLLLPMGYGQGPGQANNIGGTYETLGFVGGRSFGLSIAAAGYLSACVVGVIYLNVVCRKIDFKKELETISGHEPVDVFEDENEIPISESVDRLSVQVALVIISYVLAYALALGLQKLILAFAPGAATMLSALLWGFNFMIGMLVALALSAVLRKLQAKKIVKRQYQNNYLLNRISGLAFDIMIVAAIALIDISELRDYWLPFVLMSVLGAFGTLWYLAWLCPKLYPGYKHQAMLSLYGMLTGTISSGVLLVREIDPFLETPAANNLVMGGTFAIVFGAPMLAFVGIAQQSLNMALLTFGLMVVYLIVLLVFMIKVKRKKKPGNVGEYQI
jgi:ESS family glutamate:Na+ symporter